MFAIALDAMIKASYWQFQLIFIGESGVTCVSKCEGLQNAAMKGKEEKGKEGSMA